MAMRDLVTGGAACAVPGTASSSNPFAALANNVLGSSSKHQVPQILFAILIKKPKPVLVLKELPATALNVPSSASELIQEPTTIPGSEYESELHQQADARSSELFKSFHAADLDGFAHAWDEVHRAPILHAQSRENQDQFAEFEGIYNCSSKSIFWEGPPQRILSTFLHSFVDSGRAGIQFRPAALPILGLNQSEKKCIRDRSYIMARHIFADKNDEYITAQINALLHSLDIDNDQRLSEPTRGPFPELEEYWTESQGVLRPTVASLPDKWAAELSQQSEIGGAEALVHSFEQEHGANGWASEFVQEQSQLASTSQIRDAKFSRMGAIESSRLIANTLAQNSDQKFQNSKLLQFFSKMSRGELIIDDNQIKPASGSHPGDWADEYQNQYNFDPSTWADQFVHEEFSQGNHAWVDEFAEEHQQAINDEWVNQFSKLNVQDDWVEEFGRQAAEGAYGEGSADHSTEAYDKYLEEQLQSSKQRNASREIYVFSDMNPYVGHPNPLREGQELFRKGLLSEAVLALEAEVMKNPDNSEGWRLLGIAHAENDDDQQAIAAMMKAQKANPANLEVLLALGVSHTNELEQAEALKYLNMWLQNHPKYGTLAPSPPADSLFFNDVERLFNEAAEMSPEDADVHIVLGVLYNLSREYDRAIESFKRALKLKPRDYSLWNKLGATQANSIQSADAILAYQQALNLKPNYVRAWANMGISYANQGFYEESIPYYVRVLSMNPKADSAWQYLSASLRYVSRDDMLPACDSQNLDVLLTEFPL